MTIWLMSKVNFEPLSRLTYAYAIAQLRLWRAGTVKCERG